MQVSYDAERQAFTIVLPLGELRPSKSGKTVVLAQGTDKQSGLLDAFAQVGASVTIYGWPKVEAK